MRINDILKLSFNSLSNRGLRSWLTILGIVIGVAAVVSMLSIGNGMTQSIEESMSGLGADILTISPGFDQAQGALSGFENRGSGMMPGGKMPGDIGQFDQTESSDSDEDTLTDSDIAAISTVDGVAVVTGLITGQVEMTYLAESVRVSVEGIDPVTWSDTTTAVIGSGRSLSSGDGNAVIIGYSIANEMFDTPLTINKQIKIDGTTFKIVGIFEESGTGSFGGDDRTVFMTQTAARNIVDDVGTGEYSSIEARIVDAEQYEETSEDIEQALYASRQVDEETKDFTITTPATMAETLTSTMETLSFFFIGIAAISLIVGSIGIANTMFMSVMERTRLIGILKSLGSRNSEIMKLFLAESGIIGLMGGIMGVFLGLIMVGFISNMGLSLINMGRTSASTSVAIITPELIVFALLFSTVIGIISGLIPARNAARLQVVEAMKNE